MSARGRRIVARDYLRPPLRPRRGLRQRRDDVEPHVTRAAFEAEAAEGRFEGGREALPVEDYLPGAAMPAVDYARRRQEEGVGCVDETR